MNNNLKAEIIRNGLTVTDTARKIGLEKSALYRKIRGTSQFKQKEILALKSTLGLSNDDISRIFFGT